MYFELEVDLENGYYSDDAVDYDNSKFPDYHPQDNILAFHWNSRRWLPAIAIGPVYANSMTPIRWYHDLDCVDDVAFADTMTIEHGLGYAYNKGISRGKQIHDEELDNSYDRGYNHGKPIQAAQINGAFAAGRLQGEQASINRSSSCVSTVRALSAIRCSVMTPINEESTPTISDEVPRFLLLEICPNKT
jgi:hypothetical protein